MPFARIIDNLPVPITSQIVVGDMFLPITTLNAWSDGERAAVGVLTIVDDDIPEGKITTESTLENDNGTIRRRWTLEDAPSPPPPQQVTLSDWRVALIQLGRFDDVMAAVVAARDSGTPEGKVAWERFEYANHVYRSQLLQMAPAFGFSEADVDQSLELAASLSNT